MRKESSMG